MSHSRPYRLTLAQEIACARSNMVTPPWTLEEQAAEAKAPKK